MQITHFQIFLYQYYTTHKIPKFIVTSELPQNYEFLTNLLSKKAGFQIKIIVPRQGKRKDMIKLIIKNIDLIHSNDGDPGLVELQEKLDLPKIPKVIECFDISNHGEDYAVGSMSRFVNAQPNKSGYRKFKIKTVTGRDDYAMINEIVKRRYYKLSEENQEFPDLVLIDGGKGQLKSALNALQSLGVKIPCASLAKENEEVFLPKRKQSIIIEKK